MEIDTNTHIIQLVQSRPILYSKCSDFRARSHQWKEIADILKVDVSWVKSRWHLLRAKFLMEYSSEIKGKHTTFKYFNDMSFLVSHININAFEMHSKENELRTQPEFIISKQDLEDESDDDSSNTFIELELDEGANKELIQIQQTLDLTDDISENELDEGLYLSNGELSGHPQPVKGPKYEFDAEVETFHIVELNEKEDSTTVVIKENTNDNAQEADETSCSELVTSNSNGQKEMLKPIPEASEANNFVKSVKHRCEDSIFGELVTATLRKMPSEKKRAVKREIMNILFT